MSKRSYHYNESSPNIVIVPTVSFCGKDSSVPPAKKAKLESNPSGEAPAYPVQEKPEGTPILLQPYNAVTQVQFNTPEYTYVEPLEYNSAHTSVTPYSLPPYQYPVPGNVNQNINHPVVFDASVPLQMQNYQIPHQSVVPMSESAYFSHQVYVPFTVSTNTSTPYNENKELSTLTPESKLQNLKTKVKEKTMNTSSWASNYLMSIGQVCKKPALIKMNLLRKSTSNEEPSSTKTKLAEKQSTENEEPKNKTNHGTIDRTFKTKSSTMNKLLNEKYNYSQDVNLSLKKYENNQGTYKTNIPEKETFANEKQTSTNSKYMEANNQNRSIKKSLSLKRQDNENKISYIKTNDKIKKASKQVTTHSSEANSSQNSSTHYSLHKHKSPNKLRRVSELKSVVNKYTNSDKSSTKTSRDYNVANNYESCKDKQRYNSSKINHRGSPSRRTNYTKNEHETKHKTTKNTDQEEKSRKAYKILKDMIKGKIKHSKKEKTRSKSKDKNQSKYDYKSSDVKTKKYKSNSPSKGSSSSNNDINKSSTSMNSVVQLNSLNLNKTDKDFDLRAKLSRKNLNECFSKIRYINDNNFDEVERDNLIITVENENKEQIESIREDERKRKAEKLKNKKCKSFKLVINVICENSQSSNSENEEVELPSEELSFLDDLNIDEIVETLKNYKNDVDNTNSTDTNNTDTSMMKSIDLSSILISDDEISNASTIHLEEIDDSNDSGKQSEALKIKQEDTITLENNHNISDTRRSNANVNMSIQQVFENLTSADEYIKTNSKIENQNSSPKEPLIAVRELQKERLDNDNSICRNITSNNLSFKSYSHTERTKDDNPTENKELATADSLNILKNIKQEAPEEIFKGNDEDETNETVLNKYIGNIKKHNEIISENVINNTNKATNIQNNITLANQIKQEMLDEVQEKASDVVVSDSSRTDDCDKHLPEPVNIALHSTTKVDSSDMNKNVDSCDKETRSEKHNEMIIENVINNTDDTNKATNIQNNITLASQIKQELLDEVQEKASNVVVNDSSRTDDCDKHLPEPVNIALHSNTKVDSSDMNQNIDSCDKETRSDMNKNSFNTEMKLETNLKFTSCNNQFNTKQNNSINTNKCENETVVIKTEPMVLDKIELSGNKIEYNKETLHCTDDIGKESSDKTEIETNTEVKSHILLSETISNTDTNIQNAESCLTNSQNYMKHTVIKQNSSVQSDTTNDKDTNIKLSHPQQSNDKVEDKENPEDSKIDIQNTKQIITVQNDTDVSIANEAGDKDIKIKDVTQDTKTKTVTTIGKNSSKDSTSKCGTPTSSRNHSPIRSPDTNSKCVQNQTQLKSQVSPALNTKLGKTFTMKLEERMQEYLNEPYKITGLLNSGKFSKIFMCRDSKNYPYAVKVLNEAYDRYQMGVLKENMMFDVQRDIPKENLTFVYLFNGFGLKSRWCFLMEYCCKSLKDALEEKKTPFHINQVQLLSRQLVSAVTFLRHKNIVHSDIRPGHVLLNASNDKLKLCGFDSAYYDGKRKILPNIGTVNYRAPEIILGYSAGFSIDVWSTALVMYEMTTKRQLFPGTYNNDILFKIMCTVGRIPIDMIKQSMYAHVHFLGAKFIRRYGFKTWEFTLLYENQIARNNILISTIMASYHRVHANCTPDNPMEKTIYHEKLTAFHGLLKQMLEVHPNNRLPIEFVYANPFLFEGFDSQSFERFI